MREADISVAVIEQSGRSDNLIHPLKATDMEITVDPDDPYSRDIVILDTPDREMAYEVLKKPLHDAKVVFRMRGDPYFGIDEWIDSKLKEWLAKNVVMPGVDGCITITPYHAELFEGKTGVTSAVAQLPIDPSKWPETTHTDTELRIVSLTNCMYWPKIRPLIRAAPVVNAALDDIGGHWRIGGDGNYENELREMVAKYEHITYDGYLDANEELQWANCMIHLSNLDGWPNAILEGMSSHLPVVTNDHHAFTDKDRPNIVTQSDDTLRVALQNLSDPDYRQEIGNTGEHYVKQQHNPELLGQDYVEYFRRLLSKEHFKELHGIEHPDEYVEYDG